MYQKQNRKRKSYDSSHLHHAEVNDSVLCEQETMSDEVPFQCSTPLPGYEFLPIDIEENLVVWSDSDTSGSESTDEEELIH